jgi:hypothetical protein
MSSTPLPAAIGALIRPPALTLLQIAVAASTGPDGEVDAETLALMARQVDGARQGSCRLGHAANC